MKNLLAVLDGMNFSEQQLDPIRYLMRLTKGKLTIAWLQVVPPVLPLIPAVADAMYYSNEAAGEHIGERQRLIRRNTDLLREACAARGMDFTLRTYTEDVENEITRDSRFADVLLVPHHLSLSTLPDDDPPRMISRLLRNAECPVLMLPGQMQVVKDVIFTYNGTYSSMYAIRSFLALFPALGQRKVNVLYVGDENRPYMPEETRLREYLSGKCQSLSFKTVHGAPSKAIRLTMQYKKHVLVTLGAYGRSGVSRFFNGSTADDALSLQHAWVFVTHP